MSGAGDCVKTSAWGRNWDWGKDWSVDWGKDFDKEWKENKNDADAMKDRVEDLEEAIRRAANCSDAERVQPQLQQVNQVSDGSSATVDGAGNSSCSALLANQTEASLLSGDSAALLPAMGGRRLTGRMVPADVASLTAASIVDDNNHSSSSSSVRVNPVAAAWLAGRTAATCRQAATEWMLRPLQFICEEISNLPAFFDEDDRRALRPTTSTPCAASHVEGATPAVELVPLERTWSGMNSEGKADAWEAATALQTSSEAAGSSRHLAQISIPGFIAFDVGCWYCYYGKGMCYRYNPVTVGITNANSGSAGERQTNCPTALPHSMQGTAMHK